MDINPFDQFAGVLQQQSNNNVSQPPSQMGPSDQSVASNAYSVQQPPPNNMGQPPTNGHGMYGQQPPPMQQPHTNGGNMYGPQPGMMGQQPMGESMNNMGQPNGGNIMMYGQQGQPQPQMGGQNAMRVPSQSINQAGFNNSMLSSDASVASGALVPSNIQSNPYSLGPPAPAPTAPNPYGQLQHQSSQNGMMNPFGAPPPAPQQQPSQQMNPYGQQPQPPAAPPAPQQTPQMNHPSGQQQPQPLAMDPFGAPQPPPQQQAMVPISNDPWSSGGSVVPSQPAPGPMMSPPQQQPPQIASDPWGGPPQQQSSALVPSAVSNDDPFGIFGASAPAPPQPAPQPHMQQSMNMNQSMGGGGGPPPPQQQPNNDPWADMGFGTAAPPQPVQPAPLLDEGDLFDGGIGAAAARAQKEAQQAAAANSLEPVAPSPSRSSRNKGELPPGGEWYDAKIFTPTLGVMFFKPKELVDSLFLQTSKKTVEALEDRPVVAFIVEGSSARSAGVELGHVLLKVNGIDVKNPKEASRLIKEGPRPLPLLFYVPDTPVVVAEGEHMVKYNTKETSAPNSAKDWKPKYVVIGGIIAQPWMINMYRSKVRTQCWLLILFVK